MTLTTQDAIEKVVQYLLNIPIHETPNHVVAIGDVEDHEMFEVFYFSTNNSAYGDQMTRFGKYLKDRDMRLRVVVLVINGLVPNQTLRPVSILLAMQRNGQTQQVVVDYKKEEIVKTENIKQRDKDICAMMFIGNMSGDAELDYAAHWN